MRNILPGLLLMMMCQAAAFAQIDDKIDIGCHARDTMNRTGK